MKNKVLLILLLAVVATSACIGGRQATQLPTQGLAINSFSISDSQVQSGEIVLIDMEVENVGGTTASNVQADLFEVEGQWRDTFGNLIENTMTRNIGTLKPPLPVRDIPGDFKLVSWQMQTPEIPQGITRDITIEGRVTYDYNTSGHMIIEAVSEDEFRRRQILGQESGMPADIVNSEGPIHMEIPERYRSPVVVFSSNDEDDFEKRSFRFEFVNVGNGFPITPESDGSIIGAGGKLTGTIDLLGPGVEFEACLGQEGGTHIDLEDSEIVVRLRDNQRAPIACDVRIDKDIWGNRPTDTIQFVFNIFYRYYVPAKATISVFGTR